MIGQILEYNTVVTKAEFLFMIQSANLLPSVHTITSSAHCNPLQPAANHPVHTLQQPLHLQCTLQPSTTIYTAAILSSAHCSYTIQCTLQLHYLYSVSSAPLDHHRVSLYHYWPTSRAVSRH